MSAVMEARRGGREFERKGGSYSSSHTYMINTYSMLDLQRNGLGKEKNQKKKQTCKGISN